MIWANVAFCIANDEFDITSSQFCIQAAKVTKVSYWYTFAFLLHTKFKKPVTGLSGESCCPGLTGRSRTKCRRGSRRRKRGRKRGMTRRRTRTRCRSKLLYLFYINGKKIDRRVVLSTDAVMPDWDTNPAEGFFLHALDIHGIPLLLGSLASQCRWATPLYTLSIGYLCAFCWNEYSYLADKDFTNTQ